MKWVKRVMERGQPPVAAPYATTPNGAPFPLRSWPPDAAIDIQNLAEWADRFSYPTASARNTAVPAPYKGMLTYLQDTGTLQQHNGFVWVGDTAPKIPTFLNGWTDYSSAMRYRMDHRGLVTFHVSAQHSPAVAGGAICSVPTYYSQSVNVIAACITDSGTGSYTTARLIVAPGGNVTFDTATGTKTHVWATFGYAVDFLAVR